MPRTYGLTHSGISLISAACLALLALMMLPSPADAHQVPPTASETVACDVVLLTVEDIIAASDLPADEAVWTTLPPGQPVDPLTVVAITAVVDELEACFNTGDPLRIFALFTDDIFRGLPLSDEEKAEFAASLATNPAPGPDVPRQVLIGPWAVRGLPDGRIAAAVLFGYDDEPIAYPERTKALFFVQRDGAWLIEKWTESVKIPECELPVDVEQAVGPPPGAAVRPWPTGCDEEASEPRRKQRRDRPSTSEHKNG